MQIKRLEMTGFKSFLDRTHFEFEVPVTTVVGPNGCGKSNIVDALKWITGELSAKELRGKAMEDLIFAGSEKRPPTSMMEVALTLDNSDGSGPIQYENYSEITVLRRIFRDGSSEFFINKTACRLRDIIDVFLDTGIGKNSYSIIEQGRVGAIVSGRAEDRRMMIEEAAGITKYKHRKKAAERKLEHTKQNLMRVTDVLNEIHRQVRTMERQVEKAEKHRALTEEIRALDLGIQHRARLQLLEELDTSLQGLQSIEDKASEEGARLAELEAEFEAIKLESIGKEAEFQKVQETLFETGRGVQKVESQIDLMKRDKDQLALDFERASNRKGFLESEVEENRRRVGLIEGEIISHEQRLADIQTKMEETNVQLEALANRVETEEGKAQSLKDRLIEVVNQEAGARNQLTSGTRKKDELTESIQRSEDKLQEQRSALQEAVSNVASLKERVAAEAATIDAQQKTFEDGQRDFKETQSELQSERHKRSEISNERESCQGRLNALEEFQASYQGYRKGVQAIMKAKKAGDMGGVLGLAIENIDVDAGMEKAVQAALSPYAEGIVLDARASLSDATSFLVDQKGGRLPFFVAEGSGDAGSGNGRSLPDSEKVLGRLVDKVRFQGPAKAQLSAILSDVLLVQDLNAIFELKASGVCSSMVTADGDFMTAEGVVFAGSWNEEHKALEVRKDVQELRDRIQVLEQSEAQVRENIERLELRAEDLETQIQNASDALKVAQRNHGECTRELERHDARHRHLEERIADLTLELETAQEEFEKIDASMETWDQALVQVMAERQELERETDGLNELLSQNRQNLKEVGDRHTQLQVESTTLTERRDGLKKDLERTQQAIVQGNTELESLAAELVENQVSSEKTTTGMEALEKERLSQIQVYQSQEQENRTLKDAYEAVQQAIAEKERSLRALQKSKEDTAFELSQGQMHHQEIEMKESHLVSRVFEMYAVDLKDLPEDVSVEDISVDALEDAQTKLEKKSQQRNRLGNVNLAALEEIEELRERQTFLDGQKIDLEDATQSLEDAIKKINHTTVELFASTFESINAKFIEVFPRLFRGGRAKLALQDPDNLLESGIEIVAQPPGKKLQNMNLLSGGEKALTAIALLFAIFEFKAPPFCVLDEVDAPLDEANVNRFCRIVKEMSKQTQFIVVTHNKTTMEIANNLYGITMEEPGVSRVVSVRVNDVNVAAEDEANAVIEQSVA